MPIDDRNRWDVRHRRSQISKVLVDVPSVGDLHDQHENLVVGYWSSKRRRKRSSIRSDSGEETLPGLAALAAARLPGWP